MAFIKNIILIALVAMFAVAYAQQSQGATLEDEDFEILRAANWTSCDVTTDPILSCHDCNTRKICKPVGGLLIKCSGKYRPYCANGVCSPIPSAECA